jgi:hypothetical protein
VSDDHLHGYMGNEWTGMNGIYHFKLHLDHDSMLRKALWAGQKHSSSTRVRGRLPGA